MPPAETPNPEQAQNTVPNISTLSNPTTLPPERHAYIIGTEKGMIYPIRSITRAEVATIFFRLIDDEARAQYWKQASPYSDIKLTDWFNNAVCTMTNMGVLQGYTDGNFNPSKPCTRAEFTAALVRFMNAANDTNLENHRRQHIAKNGLKPPIFRSVADVIFRDSYELPAAGDIFSDIKNHWAQDYINLAGQRNWITGSKGIGGPFEPDRPISRAEVAALVNRIYGRLQESPSDLLPDMNVWPDNKDKAMWYYLHLQSASNSYTFEWKNALYERWIAILPPRDWAALEKPHSTPNSIR